MKKLAPIIFFGLFLLIWESSIHIFKINPFVLPSPITVLKTCIEYKQDLFRASFNSGLVSLCGFLLSLIGGSLIAFFMSQSKVIENSIYPYAIFLQSVPIVAIAPIFILWFGAGTPSMILISFIISLFPIITAVTTGLTRIDSQVLELMNFYKASKWQIMCKIRIPSAIPNLITGAKTSAGLAVVGAIVGEYFTGLSGESRGLAYLIQSNQQNANYPYLFASSLCAALLGWIIFISVSICGDFILKRAHFDRKTP
ncbi:ABC transporter permease [Lentisphaera profundi]|uniref:ABC transporter permease n=1 Tax=Lentisphaera profundi TaxID=1658616 RepID=A0ABY7VWM0_9BACT|nr:ABC transporter permease [Lentisphaera profundi]WDE98646.1 ABC transporter permease [Lentisphaera profundi]